MDSLLANYVSSDEEDGEQEQQQQEDAQHSNFYSSDPQVSEKTSNSRGSLSASLPRPKEPAKSKPFSSIFSSLPPPTEPARSKPSSSIFSPLPSPKNSNSSQSLKSLETPNDDGDAPQKSSSKPSSLFGSLPPPKSAAASAKTKRVVEFKPPVNSALLYDDEDETLAKRARGSSSESKSNAASSSSVGGLAALLPPPKNAVLGGGGGGDAGRRSVLEVSEPSPSTNSVVEPSVNVHESYDNSNGEYDYSAYSSSSYSGSEYGTNPQQGVLADPQQGGLGAGEMAWSQENYSYVQNWEVEQQQQQHQYAEIAVSIPGGNRAQKRSRGGRNEVPSDNIIEVRQEELVSKRPREDQVKLTGIAFGPAYKPVSSAKDKPSKLHKRKHQIGSLYFDLKQKEMELAERRAKGQLTKAETQAKYGW